MLQGTYNIVTFVRLYIFIFVDDTYTLFNANENPLDSNHERKGKKCKKKTYLNTTNTHTYESARKRKTCAMYNKNNLNPMQQRWYTYSAVVTLLALLGFAVDYYH